jgi:hypothetical protein
MTHPTLHKQVVALDRTLHADLKINQPQMDWSVAAGVNSLLVAAVEFADLCREYPIVFVRTGSGAAAPVAVFGMANGENLYLDGASWRASYLPALLRVYPFSLSRTGADDAARTVLCIDIAWPGFSRSDGAPLFAADGSPGEHLQAMGKQLEQIERELLRTGEFCRQLVERELLRDMRFDVEMIDGQKLQVDGFLAVDEARFAALPDADVLSLQRSGMLGLIQAHFISLGNMRKLMQWRFDRDHRAN